MPYSAILPVSHPKGPFSPVQALRRYASLAVAILLLAGVTILSDGCAANKCDCPKFGGHHLSH